jgi:hypothetical protein
MQRGSKITAHHLARKLFVGVGFGAGEVDGDVGLVAYYPAVMTWGAGGNVEQGARAEFVDAAVVHGGAGTAGQDQADVFDIAAPGADGGADVLGPLPAGLIGSAADGHGAEVDEFEYSFFEGADFVGGFEAFQDCFEGWLHFSPRGLMMRQRPWVF